MIRSSLEGYITSEKVKSPDVNVSCLATIRDYLTGWRRNWAVNRLVERAHVHCALDGYLVEGGKSVS